ncbi:hypothetical protein GE061_011266 [Apolygus lucorum]|uniref:Complex I-MWFE n=1 Tax=Apolygus lucorum TaxID=248454 RepID=A0A8S9XZM0_APOLU|nr:hypothetical protein GE061_011266 [Apolygus lucorum]
MGIITSCLVAPTIVNYFLTKLVQNGNPYRRDLTESINLNLYWRDIRLSGSPYRMTGLSNIPDTDEGRPSSHSDYNDRGDQPLRRNTGPVTDPSTHTTPCPTEDEK